MDYKMEDLLPLVAELAQRYTGYESTSVTYEKAQELMGAVLLCLNEYKNSCADGLARRDISVREQYEIGKELVLKKVGENRKNLHGLS